MAKNNRNYPSRGRIKIISHCVKWYMISNNIQHSTVLFSFSEVHPKKHSKLIFIVKASSAFLYCNLLQAIKSYFLKLAHLKNRVIKRQKHLVCFSASERCIWHGGHLNWMFGCRNNKALTTGLPYITVLLLLPGITIFPTPSGNICIICARFYCPCVLYIKQKPSATQIIRIAYIVFTASYITLC